MKYYLLHEPKEGMYLITSKEAESICWTYSLRNENLRIYNSNVCYKVTPNLKVIHKNRDPIESLIKIIGIFDERPNLQMLKHTYPELFI